MIASLSDQLRNILPTSDERRMLLPILLVSVSLAAILVVWSALAAFVTLIIVLGLAVLVRIPYQALRVQRAQGASYGQIFGRVLAEVPLMLTILSLFFLPLEAWNTAIKVAGLNVMPVLQLIALTLITLSIIWRKGRISFPALQEPQLAWVGVLTIVLIASTAQSVHLMAALGALETYGTRLLLLLSVTFLVVTSGRINLLIWVLLIGMSISASSGLLDRMSGFDGRISGLSGHVNRLGSNCATLIPFALYITIRRRGFARFAALTLLVLIVTGVFTSQSRGALFSLSMLLVVLTFHFNGSARLRVVAISFAALLCFWTIVPPDFLARIQNINTDVTVQRRVAYLDLAAQMFEERPLLGYGPENFGRTYASSEYRYWLDEKARELGRPAHNTFAQILAEFGLLGALIFSLLLASNLLALHRTRMQLLRRDPYSMLPIVEATQASIAIYLFSMVFLTSHWEPLYWLLIGLPISLTLALRAYGDDTPGAGEVLA